MCMFEYLYIFSFLIYHKKNQTALNKCHQSDGPSPMQQTLDCLRTGHTFMLSIHPWIGWQTEPCTQDVGSITG